MRRAVLLVTMVGAMLLAFGGVVLAQSTTPDDPTPPPPPPPVSEREQQQHRAEDVRPDRYIVVLEGDAPGARAVADEHARDAGARVSHVYEHALKGYAAYIPAAALDRVRNDPRVDFVEQDYAQEAFAQELPKGVDRIEGNTNSTLAGNGSGSVNANVAVLDTGIAQHTDLNVAGGYNCTSSNRSAWSDGNGHGTHVAGTVGAKDDQNGVVGVAPGSKLWATKVLDNSGNGYTSWIICGIDWVSGQKHEFNDGSGDGKPGINIAVANMSLGGGASDSTCGGTDSYHNAICNSVNKGVTYAVAAGNTGAGFGATVPATYAEVLTVTAVADFDGKPGGGAAATCHSDGDDTSSSFSSFTNTTNTDQNHTIAAPGVCIRSTWKGGGYNTISGTSMASPHVAGTAALCISSGKCTGGPSGIMGKLRADAENRSKDPSVSPYYGFKDDPKSPIKIDDTKNRYYGYVMYAGGY
jgi:subtilisin